MKKYPRAIDFNQRFPFCNNIEENIDSFDLNICQKGFLWRKLISKLHLLWRMRQKLIKTLVVIMTWLFLEAQKFSVMWKCNCVFILRSTQMYTDVSFIASKIFGESFPFKGNSYSFKFDCVYLSSWNTQKYGI